MPLPCTSMAFGNLNNLCVPTAKNTTSSVLRVMTISAYSGFMSTNRS